MKINLTPTTTIYLYLHVRWTDLISCDMLAVSYILCLDGKHRKQWYGSHPDCISDTVITSMDKHDSVLSNRQGQYWLQSITILFSFSLSISNFTTRYWSYDAIKNHSLDPVVLQIRICHSCKKERYPRREQIASRTAIYHLYFLYWQEEW